MKEYYGIYGSVAENNNSVPIGESTIHSSSSSCWLWLCLCPTDCLSTSNVPLVYTIVGILFAQVSRAPRTIWVIVSITDVHDSGVYLKSPARWYSRRRCVLLHLLRMACQAQPNRSTFDTCKLGRLAPSSQLKEGKANALKFDYKLNWPTDRPPHHQQGVATVWWTDGFNDWRTGLYRECDLFCIRGSRRNSLTVPWVAGKVQINYNL